MLDLFSGIGGFALAAQWCWGDELDLVGFCEIDKYAQKVLNKNFPGVTIYNDITRLDGEDFKDIDLITGGFPCQDISQAGKGAGIDGERSGLWTEMHRIISEVRPRFALIENVPMLIHRGIDRVLCDLTQIGYDCEWQIIGADEVGAWHRRKRIWICAYISNTNSSGHVHRQIKEQPAETGVDALCESESAVHTKEMFPTPTVDDSKNTGSQSQLNRKSLGKKRTLPLSATVVVRDKELKPGDGKLNPSWVEWLMGFPIGWTDLKDSETQ